MGKTECEIERSFCSFYCGNGARRSAPGWSELLINGAGATFPYPIYSKWFDVYSKANPGVHINYQSIGSGGGIRMVTQKTVDFGASDAPLNDEQLKAAPGLLHFPTVMGAVVLAYNLPGCQNVRSNWTAR